MRKKRAEANETLALIFDATERLLLTEGYGAVSTRRTAKEAGLNPSLVHYYFKTTDDLFLAVYRKGAENALAQYREAAASPTPLRSLWSLASDPTHTSMAIEFMALANHRKSLRAEISHFGKQLRDVQASSLAGLTTRIEGELGPGGSAAFGALIVAVGRSVVMEETLGFRAGHEALKLYLEALIDRLEPTPDRQPRDGEAR